MTEKQLLGKKALVTGGTAGIGKAIALALADAGAEVAIFGTNEERGAQVVEALNQRTKGVFYKVDIANSTEVEAAIKEAVKEYGGVDILVNNAGITQDRLLMAMKEEDWDRVLDVNLKSCYNTTRAVIRTMMKARHGKIVNISSVVGLTGNPGQANYAASKAGMIGFTKAIAREVASRDIQVNCVAPGFITSSMTEVLTDEQKKEIDSRIPMGRMGRPEEVAAAVLFLVGPHSGYITGQILTVDGGMVI